MRISDWSSDVCSSDLVPGPHRVRQPAGEHTRLQSEVAVVDARQGIVEVIERLHAGSRAEGLLAVQVRVVRNVLQQRGRQHVAFPRAAGEECRAALTRGLDPRIHAFCAVIAHYMAEEGLLPAAGLHSTLHMRDVPERRSWSISVVIRRYR